MAIMEMAKQNDVEVIVLAFKPFMFEQKTERSKLALDVLREKADIIKTYDIDEALTNTDLNATIAEVFAIIYEKVESDLTRILLTE